MTKLDILDPYQLSQKHYGESGTTHEREPQLTDTVCLCHLPSSNTCYFCCTNTRGLVTLGWHLITYRARQPGAPCTDKTGQTDARRAPYPMPCSPHHRVWRGWGRLPSRSLESPVYSHLPCSCLDQWSGRRSASNSPLVGGGIPFHLSAKYSQRVSYSPQVLWDLSVHTTPKVHQLFFGDNEIKGERKKRENLPPFPVMSPFQTQSSEKVPRVQPTTEKSQKINSNLI